MTQADLLGPWAPLEGGHGTALDADGAVTAAAQIGRLLVWSQRRALLVREAPAPFPGRPRIAGERVLWGELAIPLGGGEDERVPGVQAALAEGTGEPAHAAPGTGYAPSVYAWSPDGERLVVAAGWRGAPRQPATRAVLLARSGERRALLWEDGDLAPGAAWAGAEQIVLGSRTPRVYDQSGALLRELEPGLPALRIDGAGGRILIAEPHRVTVWDDEPAARWEGQWLDAALGRDGELVALVDAGGALHAARPGGEPAPLEAPGRVAGVALAQDRIVVALGGGGGVHEAPLRT